MVSFAPPCVDAYAITLEPRGAPRRAHRFPITRVPSVALRSHRRRPGAKMAAFRERVLLSASRASGERARAQHEDDGRVLRSAARFARAPRQDDDGAADLRAPA